MSSANSENFASSFPVWIPLISFSALIAVTKTSKTVSNSAGGTLQKERQWNFPQQSRGVLRRGEPAVRQPSPSASERQSEATGVPSKQFRFIATNSWFI